MYPKERTAGGLGYSKTYLEREVTISLKSDNISLKTRLIFIFKKGVHLVKWFEKAVGKEKIIHLFDGDLDLNNVFLDTVLCYDYKLDLVFYLFDLPTNFPEKWQKSAFNAIKINLEFFNLDEIHFYSKGIHKVNGQLELLFLENKVEFNFINQNDVMLSGSSDLVRIAEIGPVKIDT